VGIYGYEEGFSYFVYFECRVFQKAHPGATCGGRGNVCWVEGAWDGFARHTENSFVLTM